MGNLISDRDTMLHSAKDLKIWEELTQECVEDGILCDVFLNSDRSANRQDWIAFIDFIVNGNCSYECVGPGRQLSKFDDSSIDSLFDPESSSSFTLTIGHLRFECLFYSEDEFELSFWPHDVQSAIELRDLVKFLISMATALGRTVYLAQENSSHVILAVRPSDGTVWYRIDEAAYERTGLLNWKVRYTSYFEMWSLH